MKNANDTGDEAMVPIEMRMEVLLNIMLLGFAGCLVIVWVMFFRLDFDFMVRILCVSLCVLGVWGVGIIRCSDSQ